MADVNKTVEEQEKEVKQDFDAVWLQTEKMGVTSTSTSKKKQEMTGTKQIRAKKKTDPQVLRNSF